MDRIAAVLPEKANSQVKPLYDEIKKMMGSVPNIFKNMGNSPLLLQAYLALSDKTNQTKLSPQLKTEIALAVSQANDCNYCLAAHSQIAKKQNIPDQDALLARKGEAKDPKSKAILKFVKTVAEKRGKVSDTDVLALKAEGVDDQELAEIFLNIMTTMFTNYFNNITDPQVDFTPAPPLR